MAKNIIIETFLLEANFSNREEIKKSINILNEKYPNSIKLYKEFDLHGYINMLILEYSIEYIKNYIYENSRGYKKINFELIYKSRRRYLGIFYKRIYYYVSFMIIKYNNKLYQIVDTGWFDKKENSKSDWWNSNLIEVEQKNKNIFIPINK